MTPLLMLCRACRLSYREAAALLNVPLDTLKAWACGRNPTPARIIDELAALYADIEETAGAISETIQPGDTIQVDGPVDRSIAAIVVAKAAGRGILVKAADTTRQHG